MGRPKRVDLGGYVYHVLNRSNARADLSQERRLRGLLANGFASARPRSWDAATFLLLDAKSLAPRPLASGRRRTFGFRPLADAHAHAALACPLPGRGNRVLVSGPIQEGPHNV